MSFVMSDRISTCYKFGYVFLKAKFTPANVFNQHKNISNCLKDCSNHNEISIENFFAMTVFSFGKEWLKRVGHKM